VDHPVVSSSSPPGAEDLPLLGGSSSGLAAIARLARSALGATGAVVTRVRGEELVFLARDGDLPPDFPPVLPAIETLCGRIAAGSEPVFIADVAADPVLGALRSVRYLGIRGYCSVPIGLGQASFQGTLSVFDRKPRQWGEEERRLLADLQVVTEAELRRLMVPEDRNPSLGLLHAVIEGTTDQVFVKDLAGRYILANSALARFEGRPAESIIGLTDEDLYRPDEAAAKRRNDMAVMASGEVRSFEHTVTGPIGGPRHFWVVKGPYRDADGRIRGVFGVAKDITERDRRETALQASEAKFRLLTSIATDAFWEHNLATGTIRWNEGLAALLGYPPSEMAPEWSWWVERIHPDDRDRVIAYEQHTIQNAIDWDCEYRFLRKDGRWAIVLDRGRMIPGPDGRPLEYLGTLHDLTRDREAEERLRHEAEELARANALLQTTLESTADGILVVDLNGRIRSYNRRFREMWRLSESLLASGDDESALREAVQQLQDPEGFIEKVRVLYRQPERESFDVLEFADGRTFERVSRPHRLGSSIIGRVWSFRDVTIHRHAEERLADSRERYRRLVDTVDGIVWEADPATCDFLFVSAQVERILGYRRAEWLDPGFWAAHLHPEDRDEAVAYRLRESRAGRNHTFEYRMLAADGHVVWLRDYVTVELADRAPVTLRGIIVDITEQKRTEEALWQREEQLRQALKMEAVGRLAGGIAHDFNNLLTAIVGYSDLLRDSLQGDPRVEEVAEIRRAADRATALTGQLLAFSRKQVLQPIDLELSGLVRGLASLLERLIGEHISLDTRAPTGPLWVRADRSQLEQVIVNLAVNARDAMPRGGLLTIEVAHVASTTRLSPAVEGVCHPPCARLTIRDTGVGMDEGTLSHLFEPFFTTKEVGQGTGLGLATVYGIVRQSGGTIQVESAPGVGSAFNIYLPLAHLPSKVGDLSPPPPLAVGGHETLLLVEDEAAVRRLASSVLRGLGYRVLEAEHGQAALDLARGTGQAIDLVITDVVMPGLSGPETAAALGKILPGSRVLYISGYPQDELKRTGLRLLTHQLLAKPFTPEQLARRVREALSPTA
jgi:PAS domain S-box-containing protein